MRKETLEIAPVSGSWSRFRLRAEQWVPKAPEQVFPFFAAAENLEILTPSFLRFEIRTPLPIPMEEGTRIRYRIRLAGIPMRWLTAIEAWEPPVRFIDRQLKGPYRLWVHEHSFEETEGGTKLVDVVDYRIHGGRLVHKLVVAPRLREIFSYRQAVIADRFGRSGSPRAPLLQGSTTEGKAGG